jgi:hypothetical protein
MIASFPSILLDEAEENLPHDLLSKAEFLRAVKTLVRELPVQFTTGDMENLFLACPFDTWKQAFGEPRDIQEHYFLPTNLP